MIIKIIVSIAWLFLMFFAVQGCPEKDRDRDVKMTFAYVFFGIVPVVIIWNI